ncbi:hypothetical protein [Yersinia intermedia]|uniref:hypothetical protein n=1 Tax=Yersinia intermedia TaxID=631 RepID=UPI0005E61DA3|nr:hypothetical protein [Yersinia intermedia]CND47774.1 Uncharacterised protein [Yersinia intermedia]
MSITIFRKMRGRVVPITVDEEHASEYLTPDYKITPKHNVPTRSFDSIASFTLPNAVCQKCGKSVFYYENSYGSRVLFDSLGPPWPIHPCYNSDPIKKSTFPHAVVPEWEPVLIDKGVITSGGGLRVQGSLGNDKIRFVFEASDFSKMKIDIKEITHLIVFASSEKGRVQTHNGKRTFMSRYVLVSQNSDTDGNPLRNGRHPNIIKEGLPDTEKQYAAEKSINNSMTHIVGTLVIRNIELVVDENENMTAIVNGSLSKKFRVSYILLEYAKINDLLSEFNEYNKIHHLITCVVKDTENDITLVFPSENGNENKVFTVSYVKRNRAENLVRVMSASKKQPAVKPTIIRRKKRERTLQEQIGSLAAKISSPMADAFLNAKKK